MGNTGGNYQLGVERSTGGALVVGGSPYATVLVTTGATNIEFGVNLQKVATLTSTGLNSTAIGATAASTGAFTTLSATGTISGTGDIASYTDANAIKFGTTGSQGIIASTRSGGNYSSLAFKTSGADGNGVTRLTLALDGSATFAVAGTTRAEVSSTGLAVTGALSSTGALAIGNTVNTVSPTSPNRTVTIVIGGTTYYLAAKTTND